MLLYDDECDKMMLIIIISDYLLLFFFFQVIWFKPDWQIIDPLCTFFFSILVLSYTLPLIQRIANVLLEGKPAHVSTQFSLYFFFVFSIFFLCLFVFL